MSYYYQSKSPSISWILNVYTDLLETSWDFGIRQPWAQVLSAVFTSCVIWEPYFNLLRSSFCFFKMEINLHQVQFQANTILLCRAQRSAWYTNSLSINGIYDNAFLFHLGVCYRTALTNLIQLKTQFLISSAQNKLEPEPSNSVLRQCLTWPGKPQMGSNFISCTGNFGLI